MRNSNHPDELKIGLTTQEMEERLKQANRHPSEFTLPGFNMKDGTFSLYAVVHVEDCRNTEKLIHKHLDPYRIVRNREFFACSLSKIDEILDIVRKNEENVNYCCGCNGDGKLILCDKCPRSYHLECKGLSRVPRGSWKCGDCSLPLKKNRGWGFSLLGFNW